MPSMQSAIGMQIWVKDLRSPHDYGSLIPPIQKLWTCPHSTGISLTSVLLGVLTHPSRLLCLPTTPWLCSKRMKLSACLVHHRRNSKFARSKMTVHLAVCQYSHTEAA